MITLDEEEMKARRGVDFLDLSTIQPLQSKSLTLTGTDLVIVAKAMDSIVGESAMHRLAQDIRENNELKKESYDKEAEAQIEFKRFQENVYARKF
ncbi:MAG: hypothetical protein V4494_03975 [Chlamydiota bacterium]